MALSVQPLQNIGQISGVTTANSTPASTLKVAPLQNQGKITQVGQLSQMQEIKPKKSVQEFSAAIKQKYPAYANADDTQLAMAMVQKYPQYADQVDMPKPPTDVAQPQGKQGFFSRLGTDFKERYNKLVERNAATDRGEQSGLEFGLQFAGQVAGGVGDVIGEGLRSAYRTVTPQSVEDKVAAAGNKVGQVLASPNNPAGKAYQAASGFMQEHPRLSANLGAIGNIASLLPVGRSAKVAGEAAEQGVLRTVESQVPKLAGKVALGLEEKSATKALNATLDTISPVLTKGEKEAAIAAGRGEAGGLFKAGKILPSPQDIEIAKTVQDIVKPGASNIKNVNAVKSAIANVGSQLQQGLKEFKGIVSPSQFKSAIEAVERPLLIASDTTLNTAYDRVIAKATQLAGKQAGTLEGLWKARVAFDDFIEKQFPRLYDDARLTPMKTAITDIRQAWNDYIAGRLPDGNPYKEQLKTMSNMYRAIDQMSTKAIGELGQNAFSKYTNVIAKHPVMAFGAATGVGVGGYLIAPILTNPITLAALAAGGTVYYGGKAITSQTVRDILTHSLKTIADPAYREAVHGILRTMEQQGVKFGATELLPKDEPNY